eukprot:CAMPEP_0197323890 /NCGR_PEP_ID=MMETSP0891-20130614/70786_1 /TAXON_ID=44058 ORGANISM="Aureoumbra lagunensis, Strain CCMP1510" /NCGR_SAMPLE_ID=MMETSP0891 /ASSEMBLY_ACC=CAM_ASM_000534 /LENGTH=1180 /DNA_ID=CAMNT_0042816621 /DNA_START=879 /DNA_END=4422 /DNA_ORIENTATION=-
MATQMQLEEFAKMPPFSSEEGKWIQGAERRIRGCRDSLLHFDMPVPEACLFDGQIERFKSYNDTNGVLTVSAILTFSNSVEMTSLSLTGLVLALSKLSHKAEVILVDDSSTESTIMIKRLGQRLTRFSGIEIRIVRTTQTFSGPIGYGMANNLALKQTNGKYILLLNNDVILFKTTILYLLLSFKSHPDVGAVVPRFVGSEGKLQEAGSVIFTDGRAMQLGSSLGLDDDDPIFRYVRSTDYGSAACLLIRRELILGGFDSIYRPAYYEDTDLSMSIRRSGFHVLYQPFAVALHKGSMTYNNATFKSGLMSKNQNLFARKWWQTLECHYSHWVTNWTNRPGIRRVLQLASRLSLFRIIFFEWSVPCFDRDSGSVRTINLIRVLLSIGAHVTFVANDVDYDSPCVYQLNWLGVHVIKQKALDLGWGDDVKSSCDYDIIFVSRRDSFAMWQRLLEIACPEVPVAFDTVDLHFLRELRELMAAKGVSYQNDIKFSQNIYHYKQRFQIIDRGMEDASATENQVARYRNWLIKLSDEVKLMNSSTATIVVSPVEVKIIRELKAMRQLRPDLAVFHISNIHDDETLGSLYSKPSNFAQRKGCLFVGNWAHPPNVDAVQFLIHEILPNLAKNPRTPSDLVLHIVGAGDPPMWVNDIRDVGGIPVVMHGFIKDLDSILAHVRVAVAPLRYGAGVKGKINSAMIHGVPVVATPMAIEGMFLTANEDVVVAENGLSFASRLLDLYLNYDLWNEIRTAAFVNVRKHFSTSTAKHGVDKLLDFFFTTQPHLQRISEDGNRALQGTGGCDRIQSKYGIGAIVPSDRIMTMNQGVHGNFEQDTMIPRNYIFDANMNFLDIVWAMSSVDKAKSRCESDKACTGWCWHPGDWTFFYYNAISHEKLQKRGNIGEFPPGWACWLNRNRIRNAPLIIQDDGYSDVRFDIVSHNSYRVYKPKASTMLEWRLLTSDDAQRRCVLNYDCAAYCHHPEDWTFFYDISFADIFLERGNSVYNAPGWTCYKRIPHEVATLNARPLLVNPVFVHVQRPSILFLDGTKKQHPGWTCYIRPVFVHVQRPSNFVFGRNEKAASSGNNNVKPYLKEAWRLNEKQARALCAKDRKCTGYCNHPDDFTFLYEHILDEHHMQQRGELNQYPPGWTCYIRPNLLASIRKAGSNMQLAYAQLQSGIQGDPLNGRLN